ncbi:hypothetical protein MCHI_003737 [Candidatus Magnetoovum chiemensis]|nr:hypothetical protein MCHI_003737 [Candidatus Magnetoovum chiemensis]
MTPKQDYTNPHDADNTYTWYDGNPATNGGYAGAAGEGTDTEDFIKALNDSKFGGLWSIIFCFKKCYEITNLLLCFHW